MLLTDHCGLRNELGIDLSWLLRISPLLPVNCVCPQCDLNKVRVDVFQKTFWISPYDKVKAS